MTPDVATASDLKKEVVLNLVAHAKEVLEVATLVQEGAYGRAMGTLGLEDADLRASIRDLIAEEQRERGRASPWSTLQEAVRG